MAGFKWVKTHYLDASVLVKLVVDEGDCAPVRQFFYANTNFCTTSLCLAEAIGALKRKWERGGIETDDYFRAIRDLIVNAWGKRIEVDDLGFVDPSVQSRVETTARQHSLDLSDALQLFTILHGRYSVLGPNSASVLITADDKLEVAASSEGIRVWNCRTSQQPSWAV
jgi:predicted nucleic acid-binding protein